MNENEGGSAALESARTNRFLTLLPFLLVAVALFFIVLPALPSALQYYDRDTSRCEAPFKWEMWKRLAAGQFPLWVTWTEGGTSLFGQMTPGLFHPTALLYLLPFSFELLFKLQHVLALPLAGAGMYLFARRCGAGRFGAASGGVAFAGSGWVVSMSSSNLHYALGAAAIPWALYGLMRFIDTRKPLWLLAGALSLASPVLTGEPQSSLLAGIIGVAIAAGLAIGAADWRRALPRNLLLAALWGIAGLMISAPAGAPVIARLRTMASAPGNGVGREHFTMPPWRLIGLALPEALDDTLEFTDTNHVPPYIDLARDTPFGAGITLGVPVLLLAFFAPGRKRVWLLGAAGITALAAMGPSTPVDALLLKLIPPLAWFRYPEKWIAATTFFLCAGAALGASTVFEHLPSREAMARRLLIASLATAAILGALGLGLYLSTGAAGSWVQTKLATHSADTATFFVGELVAALKEEALFICALAGIAWFSLRWKQAQAAILPAALCTALLGSSAMSNCGSLIGTAPITDLRSSFPLVDELHRRADESTGPLRIRSTTRQRLILDVTDTRLALTLARIHGLAAEDNAFRGIASVDFYSSLLDVDYIAVYASAPVLLRTLFDVQIVLADELEITPDQRAVQTWEPLPYGLAMRVLPSHPRAFLVPCAAAMERSAAFRKITATDFSLYDLAIVREGDAKAVAGLACPPPLEGAEPSPPLPMRWTRPSPEEIDVDVDANAPAMLVISEHFDPGWSASIDGASAVDAFQIDRSALGAAVPAGKHRVTFRFFPKGLRLGILLALGCILTIAAGAVFERARRRPSPAS